MALETGNPFLDAIGGTPWPKTAANTSTVDGALLLTVYFDNDTSKGHSTGGAWTDAEKSAFSSALHTWSTVANIRFLEVDNTRAADLIERKVTEAELPGDLGDTNFPTDPKHIGRFNANEYWTPDAMQRGGYTFETFVHEIGHGIGMAHPHDLGNGTGLFPGVEPVNDDGSGDPADRGDNGLNSIPYTIMSYNEADGSDANTAADRGFAATPLAFDIAAVQLMYGAVANNAGDTVYTLRDDGPGTSYSCIWDTGGIDTIRYDGTRNATIDLRAATLADAPGGGGFLSHVDGVLGGFTIAADITDFDHNGNLGVVIENAVGGSGNDSLTGNAANNRLEGGAGSDRLDGGGGRDTLIGGAGDDTYILGDVSPILLGKLLIGESYDTVVEAADGGIDTVKVGHVVGALFDHTSYTLPDNVEIGVVNGVDPFSITGNELDNQLIGNDAANTLTGLGGDDYLDGEGGRDTLIGGAGNDTYVLSDVSAISQGGLLIGESYDTVVEASGEGEDTVLVGHVVGALSDHTHYTLPDNVENGFVIGSDPFSITGNELDNHLTGNDAANTLTGLGGNDILNGGGGLDTLIGGEGDDYYILRDVSAIAAGGLLIGESYDTVVEAADGGNDTVAVGHVVGALRDFTHYTLPDNVENSVVDGVDPFSITGNELDNQLTGNDAANTLSGAGGNDTLNGSGGLDTLIGGAGDDTYVLQDVSPIFFAGLLVGEAFDTIVEAPDQGEDWVLVGHVAGLLRDFTHYTLPENVENARVLGSDPFGIVGNELANKIYGNDAANRLAGLDGNDVLDGGAGNDIMVGGLGDDTYHVDSEADVAVENPDEGSDTIYSTVNYTLPANVETLVLEEAAPAAINGAGNDDMNWIYGNSLDNALSGYGGDDILLGGAGNDILDGGIGNDVMVGGLGDDTYYVDSEADTIVENPGEGTDTVFASINYTLSNNFETLFLVEGAPDAINGAGNDVQNFIYGNSLDNALSGYVGDDVLVGGGGNDILDGGIGNDVMAGGLGDDTYYVDSEADTIIENPDEGTDTVFASINYTLADNFETLFLQEGAAAAINGAGNDSDNRIYGNALDNALSGYGGHDILVGGAGNDILDGGPGADILAGGSGKDTFVFHAGEANGDAIIDFSGAGGDRDTLRFVDYGTAAQGANLTRLDATHWSVNSADGTVHDIIQLTNGASVHASDHLFI